MTQEEKDLLLKDLCGRLPYMDDLKVARYVEQDGGIKDFMPNFPFSLDVLNICIRNPEFIIKPYLRTMNSMTKEEILEYRQHQTNYEFGYFDNYESIDWLNKHHFDYRGLIPMGLAIEAPEDLYSNESEYDENGWKDLGNGLKVNRLGHVELTEKERKKIEDSMYNENGWKDLGNGLKMDKDGHIAGGLKLK